MKNRYEPPYPVRPDPKPFLKKISNPQYELKIDENYPGFKVLRRSDERSMSVHLDLHLQLVNLIRTKTQNDDTFELKNFQIQFNRIRWLCIRRSISPN